MSLNLSAIAVRERAVTLFFILLLAAAGAYAFLMLGRAEDPSFTIKTLTVTTAWPGATAREMQDLVAEPLEKRLQELTWYDRVETTTRPGYAYMTVTLKDSTPPSVVQEEFYQARKKLGDEARNLPSGVLGPFVNDEYSDVSFALYALKAKGMPMRELARQAEMIRQDLLHVPGVKKINILGERPEQIFVEFSYAKLATLGVSAQDIVAALQRQNTVTPAGSIDTQGPQVFIRVDGAYDSVQAIADTPIVAAGRTLKLSDIAEVRRGYEDPPTYLIRHQGEPTIMLAAVMQEGWDGLALGKALEDRAAAIAQTLPLGMTLDKVTDQAVNITSAVDEFMMKFAMALGVVLLVSLLSLGWRVGIVVAAAVPLTLAVVFLIMLETGRFFDRITLGALILALGLLVDDAIIAIEVMVVKMEEGMDRIKAAAYAWSHTAAPMLSGTLVTIAGFLPVGFARSTAGEYAGNIFWVVGFALIVSWIVAVVFTPYLGVKMLPAIKPVEGGHHAIYDTPNYRRLRRLITFAVRHKFVTCGIVGIAFALSGVGMGAVKQQFFPTSDRPEVLVEVRLPEGTSIETTTAAVEKLEHWLEQQPEAKIVTSYVGQGAPRFFFAMAPELPDPAFAKIVVLTPDADAREALKHRLREAVSQGLAPEAFVRVTQLVFGPYYAVPGRVPGHGARSRATVRHLRKGPRHHAARPGRAAGQPRLGQSHARAPLHPGSGSTEPHRPLASGGGSAAPVPPHRHRRHAGPRGHPQCPRRGTQRRRRAAGSDAPGDFSLMSRDGRQDSARPDRPFGNPSGRADPEAPRPHARHHDRSDINEATQPPEVSKEVMTALQPLIASLPAGYRIEMGGVDRGGGQGQHRAGQSLPGHDRRHADRHHAAGAILLDDGHGHADGTARPRRRRADAAHLQPALRIQRHSGPDRTGRHPDAQYADPDRTDQGEPRRRPRRLSRCHRGHGATHAAGDPDRTCRRAGLHPPHALRLLGIDGLYADRRHGGRHGADPAVPSGALCRVVPDQTNSRTYRRSQGSIAHDQFQFRRDRSA